MPKSARFLQLQTFWREKQRFVWTSLAGSALLIGITIATWFAWNNWQSYSAYVRSLENENRSSAEYSASLSATLTKLQNEDQRVRNDALQEQLENLKTANTQATTEYERLLVLQDRNYDTKELEETWAQILAFLADHNYASAEASLATLQTNISAAEQQLAAAAAIPAPTASTTSNDAPNSGYSRQQVQTDIGSFVVSLVAGDLSSTRVIVDTASGSDCANDCPVLPLSDYVSRNGAYAGINGTYFCPASYPSCAGKRIRLISWS